MEPFVGNRQGRLTFPATVLGELHPVRRIERPVLCADEFSDKIGAVRTSRMIFGGDVRLAFGA